MKKKSLSRAVALALSVAFILPSNVFASSQKETKQVNKNLSYRYSNEYCVDYPAGTMPIDLSEIDDELIIDDVNDYYLELAKEEKAEKFDMVTPAEAVASDSEYSEDEIVSLTSKEIKQAKTDAKNAVSQLPLSVDNSLSKYFPPIQMQEGGSCSTFAQVYYQFTYTMNKFRNVPSTIPNSFSPYFIYAFNNNNNGQGGSAPKFNYEMLLNKGCLTCSQRDLSQGFDSWVPSEEMWNNADNFRISSYEFFGTELGVGDHRITSVDDPDLNTIKTALNNGEILAFCTFIFSFKEDKIKYNSSLPENNKFAGEIIVRDTAGQEGYHGMCIVGYNDNIWCDVDNDNEVDPGEMGALKIANSWDKSYCNNGFIWLSYDALNSISCVTDKQHEEDLEENPILIGVSRITPAKLNGDSDIKLVYSLNAKNRQIIDLQVNVYDTLTGETYSKQVNPYGLPDYYDITSCTFDGSSVKDGTMTFDLDNIVKNISSNNLNRYKISVTASSNSSSIGYKIRNLYLKDYISGNVYPIENTSSFPISVTSNSKTVNISDKKTDYIKIIYKGFNKPKIHYQIGNGSWTNAPGKSMIAYRDFNGYKYEYMIYLDNSKSAKVCFNDGNGRWDNNNGADYRFEAGTYLFDNGNIKKIDQCTRYSDVQK